MPKFYVQSGPVELVLQARTALKAAVKAFEWSCQRQATIQAATPLEHVQTAEALGWQLHEQVCVSEKGFGSPDARVFDTLDVVAAWQGDAFPWVDSRGSSPAHVDTTVPHRRSKALDRSRCGTALENN